MMPLSLWKRLTPTKNRIPFSVEKNCARPSLDKQRLGELIDLISTLGLGDAENRSKDIIRRVYEYFLSEFASAEGRQGGQFYTPRCVVRTLVAMISPFKVRAYDPCCGSGGMFVQSEKFVEAHGGRIGDISIYGQESNPTTWKLPKMNLAIRGIDHDLGTEHANSFKRDLHPNLKADYILANLPFNMKDWGGENLKDDVRWKNGIPPTGNANYAWIQHFLYHLSPTGSAGFVLAKGSLTSKSSGEGEIRKALIEARLVDCIVNLPAKLFLNTQIPASLWFLSRNKANGGYRNRTDEILFIDARNLGHLINRRTLELSHDDIQQIASTYHAWRTGDPSPSVGARCTRPDDVTRADAMGAHAMRPYEDVRGFCASVPISRVAELDYVLTPGRYVGLPDEEDDFNFPERFAALKVEFEAQLQEEAALNRAIVESLVRVKL